MQYTVQRLWKRSHRVLLSEPQSRRLLLLFTGLVSDSSAGAFAARFGSEPADVRNFNQAKTESKSAVLLSRRKILA